MMNSKQSKQNSGQAMIIMIVIFITVSIIATMGIVNPVLSHLQAMKNFSETKKSYYFAESGVEDVIYRIKNGITVAENNNLVLDGENIVTSISDDVSGNKIITSISNREDYTRKIETALVIGEGVAFNFALQTGNGGFFIDGGSTVDGNVYSNGNIIGDGGSTITGSATAANTPVISANQTNNSPTTPPNQIIFGNNNATQDFAQSFVVNESGPLNKASFYLRRTSSAPNNLTVRIVADNGGVPGSTTLDSATLSAGLVSTSYGWVDVVFGSYIPLNEGTTYWVVLDGGTNSSRYYTIGANTNYANGVAKIGRVGSSWNNTSPVGLDGYFEIYLNGFVSKIEGDGYDYLRVGTKGGDSWANTVNSTNTYGTIYCQNGTMNNGKSCNTSRSDPSPQNFPVSESNINGWKDEAEAGGVYNGDYSVGWAGATLGPTKINGDLSIAGGGTLNVTGTIWVTGTVTVSGGGKIKLDSSYGNRSGVLVVDGRVSISGNGQFSGSGQTGSYPLVVTTSVCPYDALCSENNALSISGGSGAVVLAAPYGALQMNGGTSAKAMMAYKIIISGGGQVNYETGLADLNFSSGPTGGFNILSWKEVE